MQTDLQDLLPLSFMKGGKNQPSRCEMDEICQDDPEGAVFECINPDF